MTLLSSAFIDTKQFHCHKMLTIHKTFYTQKTFNDKLETDVEIIFQFFTLDDLFMYTQNENDFSTLFMHGIFLLKVFEYLITISPIT